MVGAALVAVDLAGAADGLLQRGAHGRVEAGQGGVDRVLGDADVGEPDPVEALGELDQRLDTAMADVLAQGAHALGGVRHVHGRARKGVAGVVLAASEVDSTDHAPSLGGDARRVGSGVRMVDTTPAPMGRVSAFGAFATSGNENAK